MRVLLADVVPVFQFENCLMKIASFNINGIKARTPALINWLKESKPDVALLQEIKSIDEAFPKEIFEDCSEQGNKVTISFSIFLL